MKKTLIVGAVVASTALLALTGCEQEPTDAEIQAAIDEEAKAQTMSDMASEDVELKQKLLELQKVDPAVKDAYYSVDENGVKHLHVVKEDPSKKDENGASGMSESVWPLVAGLAGGALLMNMMNSGGSSAYANRYPPSSYQSGFTREEEKKRRGTYTSSYVNTAMMNNRSSIASNPARLSSVRTNLSTRTSGALSSSSSARASSHSSSS